MSFSFEKKLTDDFEPDYEKPKNPSSPAQVPIPKPPKEKPPKKN